MSVDLETAVVERYLDDDQFRGLDLALAGEIASDAVRTAVNARRVVIFSSDDFPNPHILAVPPGPPASQLAALDQPEGKAICLYPSPELLAERVDASVYAGRPYTLRLALGAPQIEHLFFDLGILEMYRNDPRYHYHSDDVGGRISASSRAVAEGLLAARDQRPPERFGFAYDTATETRAVTVVTRDLSPLSPDHQQLWRARELQGSFLVHPLHLGRVGGHWDELLPVCDAILAEAREVNAICAEAGRPALFLKCYSLGTRPDRFGLLVRPTQRELDEFVELFDKLLSDNIDRKFFGGEVPTNSERERDDGKIEVVQKGTRQLLEDWLEKRGVNHTDIETICAPMKEVRNHRSKTSHAIGDDSFDQEHLRTQRRLLRAVREGLIRLRQVLPEALGLPERDPDDLLKMRVIDF